MFLKLLSKPSPLIIYLYLTSLFIFIPAICFADGGGPILLIVNAYVFTIGQIWILLSEYIYMTVLLKKTALSKRNILKITFIMNILSTIVGALLFPFLLAIVTLPGAFFSGTKWGGLLMAIGTWMSGDNSPYPEVAIGAAIVGFIITYILTVWIEYKYLMRLSQKRQIIFGKSLFKHCIYLNIISYTGLIALFYICLF